MENYIFYTLPDEKPDILNEVTIFKSAVPALPRSIFVGGLAHAKHAQRIKISATEITNMKRTVTLFRKGKELKYEGTIIDKLDSSDKKFFEDLYNKYEQVMINNYRHVKNLDPKATITDDQLAHIIANDLNTRGKCIERDYYGNEVIKKENKK